ncbi:MAG: hypothetical protein QNJ64_11055 [Crocosphaera sp.]|nr:hypothetical protein [Crocosphaera sp.]
MLRQFIWLLPLMAVTIPLPSQALPTADQINETAQRICQIPEASSEMTRNIYYQEVAKWVNTGNISIDDMEDETIRETITTQVIKEINNTCPDISTHINNQIWNVVMTHH